MMYSRSILAMAVVLCQASAWAQMSHNHASEAACETTELRCATKVTPAFGSDGRLWLVWMAGGHVSVASSGDGGQSLSTPVQATRDKLNLDWGPDARPKIAVDRNGRIAIAFSIFKASRSAIASEATTDGCPLRNVAEARKRVVP